MKTGLFVKKHSPSGYRRPFSRPNVEVATRPAAPQAEPTPYPESQMDAYHTDCEELEQLCTDIHRYLAVTPDVFNHLF